jgi:hypothetical protein
MVKIEPLLKRYYDTKQIISDEWHEQKLYDLVGRISKKAPKYSDYKEFYRLINPKSLNPYIALKKGKNGIYSEHYSDGKNLIGIIEENLVLPLKGERNYNHQMNEIMKEEFEIIKSYYTKNKN